MSYQHIHPDFQHILLLSDQERIAFLDAPRWIGYQRAQTILDTLQGLMQKPKRPRMPNLLIVGESNNGKTTIIDRFNQLCGQGYVDDNSDPVKPVIIAEAPPEADEKAQGLPKILANKFYLDELYMAIVVQPIYALSAFCKKYPKRTLNDTRKEIPNAFLGAIPLSTRSTCCPACWII